MDSRNNKAGGRQEERPQLDDRPSRDHILSEGPSYLSMKNRKGISIFTTAQRIPYIVLFILLTIWTLFSGCSSTRSLNPAVCKRLETAVVEGNFPRSLAVLPFRDHTGTDDLGNLVRDNFYSRLSILPYRDIELALVDTRLAQNGITDHETLFRTGVKRLGTILGCDAVVYGEINDFDRIFAGIYSSLNVEATIQIWDTRTGEQIWADRQRVRTQEGGVPLTILDIPLITFRSGYNLRDTVKVDTVDKLSRRLVSNIPAPRFIRDNRTARSDTFELQVGAFSEIARARRVQEQLLKEGFPAFIRLNTDERGILHRVIVGPYASRTQATQVKRQIRQDLGADCFISTRNS